MIDSFQTVAATVETELKEKGSRFIGHLHRCTDKEAAEEILSEYRKKYYDATHNCFAWFIDTDDFRYSDDGEPSGTAGRPIYQVLTGSGLKQLMCVVTRYFGGTKLGTGGLIRAYSASAKKCLDQAPKKTVLIKGQLKFSHAYNVTSAVMHLIDKYAVTIISSQYNNGTQLIIELRKSAMEAFKNELIEATAGGVQFED